MLFATRRAPVVAHVFNHAQHVHPQFRGVANRLLHDVRGHFRRRRHHNRAGKVGKETRQHGRFIRGSTRGKISQQIIQVAPDHIGEEFPNHVHFHEAQPHRAQIHRAFPSNRRGVTEQEIHGSHFDAIGTFRRPCPFRCDLHAFAVHPQHPGHAGTIEVHVNDPDRRTLPCPRQRQIDRRHALADPAFAAHHHDLLLDPGHAVLNLPGLPGDLLNNLRVVGIV